MHDLEGAVGPPGRGEGPRRTGARTRPSICPHGKPSRAGPHAGSPQRALSGSGGLRHTALGWGVRTPRSRRRTAATVGRLPPGIWVSSMASGHGPTDSSDAGDQRASGLRSPRSRAPMGVFKPTAHPQGTSATAHGTGVVVGDHPRARGGARCTDPEPAGDREAACQVWKHGLDSGRLALAFPYTHRPSLGRFSACKR